MIIFGKRSKPTAYPHYLARVQDGKVSVLGHGIWGRSMEKELNVVANDIERMRAKSQVVEYDADIWGQQNPFPVCSLVVHQDISLYFPAYTLGAIADKDWSGIALLVVSHTVYDVFGEHFHWVQRSGASINSRSYPVDGSVIWEDLETSLFGVDKAAEKKFDELRNAWSSPGREALHLHGGPMERLAGNRTWIEVIADAAKDIIEVRANAEQQKELRRQQEEAEARRRAEEERQAAERRAEEKRKAERKRLQELMDKPAGELSPEEFALRMRLRREQRDESGT